MTTTTKGLAANQARKDRPKYLSDIQNLWLDIINHYYIPIGGEIGTIMQKDDKVLIDITINSGRLESTTINCINCPYVINSFGDKQLSIIYYLTL